MRLSSMCFVQTPSSSRMAGEIDVSIFLEENRDQFLKLWVFSVGHSGSIVKLLYFKNNFTTLSVYDFAIFLIKVPQCIVLLIDRNISCTSTVAWQIINMSPYRPGTVSGSRIILVHSKNTNCDCFFMIE